jgi:hypothetical protein
MLAPSSFRPSRQAAPTVPGSSYWAEMPCWRPSIIRHIRSRRDAATPDAVRSRVRACCRPGHPSVTAWTSPSGLLDHTVAPASVRNAYMPAGAAPAPADLVPWVPPRSRWRVPGRRGPSGHGAAGGSRRARTVGRPHRCRNAPAAHAGEGLTQPHRGLVDGQRIDPARGLRFQARSLLVVAWRRSRGCAPPRPRPGDCLGPDEVKPLARTRPLVCQVNVGASAVPPGQEWHRHHRAPDREDSRQQPEPSDASPHCHRLLLDRSELAVWPPWLLQMHESPPAECMVTSLSSDFSRFVA